MECRQFPVFFLTNNTGAPKAVCDRVKNPFSRKLSNCLYRFPRTFCGTGNILLASALSSYSISRSRVSDLVSPPCIFGGFGDGVGDDI
ncbi:hypothetical protein PPL_04504 [Heterostelium album PN500]|uniref:Uncharacterized protein n=1 Tax=Heterostelium pallidum (strain ATCC 26659 / Pp 5 / PN500) TaxID=670386 RepID=D3B7R6_HETP5|nr:hypothetical protein PPL_04504 [Heterostelium album PN500]EFA82809.1 hypothetical protein PPL_04504 [Heterostelium album PN500]|eukprot:XP_020434926.1 hypothetical protein PPL_04504 [Heterostelium album PN500]